jgi:hypothetical protein
MANYSFMSLIRASSITERSLAERQLSAVTTFQEPLCQGTDTTATYLTPANGGVCYVPEAPFVSVILEGAFFGCQLPPRKGWQIAIRFQDNPLNGSFKDITHRGVDDSGWRKGEKDFNADFQVVFVRIGGFISYVNSVETQ